MITRLLDISADYFVRVDLDRILGLTVFLTFLICISYLQITLVVQIAVGFPEAAGSYHNGALSIHPEQKPRRICNSSRNLSTLSSPALVISRWNRNIVTTLTLSGTNKP